METADEDMSYRAIFEATGDAMLIVDPQDFHIVEANPAACQAYGYPYEEFVGLHLTSLVHRVGDCSNCFSQAPSLSNNSPSFPAAYLLMLRRCLGS